jgi:hypothetical protein
VDVEEIADRLYALPLDEFTRARDDAAKEAQDADTRKAIKALRKPTAGAHAVNSVVRDHAGQVDRLLALGEEMRAAMGGDPGEVRRLTEERRSFIGSLIDPDLPAAVQQDVTASLEAATADPELGAAVRSGRLVKPLRYAVFGAMPDLDDAMATPLRLVRRDQTTPAKTTKKPATKKPAEKAPPTEKAPTAKKVPAKQTAPKAAAEAPSADLAAARQRCLDLAGKADDAQRRYELAVKAATEARKLLDEAEAERADAHKAAREAHREAERARREVGRLERS